MFTVSPNLPQNNVNAVLLGEKYSDFLYKPLFSRGVNILPVPSCEDLKGEERHHADMLTLYLGQGRLFVCKNIYCKVNKLYTDFGLEIFQGESALRQKYPQNIACNGLIIGKRYFHLQKYSTSAVHAKLSDGGFTLVNVKQGYSKCAVSVIDENSAITSDRGMADALIREGIDTLLISPGYIYLDGTREGFIGGCTGKIAKNEIAFTGTLEKHPDRERIINFLNSKKVRPVFLTSGPLIDVGSILPIKEEEPKTGK